MYYCYNFHLIDLSKISFFDIQFNHLFNLGTFFLGGAVLATYNFELILKNNIYKYTTFFILFLAIFISIKLNYYNNFKHILLTGLILLFGLFSFYPINNINKIGDLSYGIYIYSFPIQQTLMYYFKFSTYKLIYLSIILSLIFGFISWHLVEKKALILKNKYK